MTEKRFVYEVFDIVDFKPEEFKLYEIDNNPADDLDESNLFYVYSTSKANIEHLVERLNELFDENEQLKQLLDEAEDIILCQCTPHYQRQWENIKKNLKR